jgi:hypothetical protein
VVFVERDPLRRAGAPEVDPAHDEAALLAEPLVLLGVRRREVVHPVRQRLEDDGCGEVVRKEEPGREPRVVGHPDPGVPVLHGRAS